MAAKAASKPADNLTLWDSLATTDPKYTKEFKRGNWFKGTAINPTWIAKRLTETFGPCGIGWKLVVEDERFVSGATLIDPTVPNAAAVATDREIVHTIRGHLEYKSPNGEWVSTGPQYGQTFFVTRNKAGVVYTDEEAPKKSITDCLSKCASLIGISADIYLGEWDANKYINDQVHPQLEPGQKLEGPVVVPPSAEVPAAPAKAPRKPRATKAAAAAPSTPAVVAPPVAAAPVAPQVGTTTEECPFDVPLPTERGAWTPADWRQHLEEMDPTPDQLVAEYQSAIDQGWLAIDPATWKAICLVFGDIYKVVCEGPSTGRQTLLAMMRDQKRLLDAATK